MNNEPVAILNTRGNGIDIDWQLSVREIFAIPDGTPLYTHPAKHLSLQKVNGELVAVTYTDDEYRIIEVLWEKPPKDLTDEEQFKDAYMANFLSAYMAVRYDNDCANGHPLKGYQPIEDAQFLANEAWAILKKASEK